MSHDVFISYSNPDQHAALAVLHGLESAGIRCWMAPRDISPGKVWAQAIMDGIAGSRVMVVVFSASANKSSHVLNEVDAAVRKGAVVVPFRIEDVMPDGAMEYHLRTRHWLDALTPDMAAHATNLAVQVRQLLDVSTAGPAMTPPPGPMPQGLPKRKEIKKPKPALPLKRLAIRGAAVLVVLAGAGWWFLREKPISAVEFTVKEVSSSGGNAMSFRLKSQPLRFFEGPNEAPPLAQRQYTKTFAAGATRYLYPEITLTYDPPGKELRVPISCAVTKDGGQVVTNISIMSRIQATWDTSSHTQGWGTAGGGTWEPGRYRFDCSFGSKLIARDWVEVVGGGAAPPPIPPPPPANTPPPAANPGNGSGTSLASIGGRVTNIRVFPSPPKLPALELRPETRLFESSTTSYIGIQVTLAHPAPGRLVSLQLVCRFLQAQRREVGSVTLRYQIQPDWTGTVNASNWGRENPGFWTPGGYTAVCQDEAGRTVGQVGFTVR